MNYKIEIANKKVFHSDISKIPVRELDNIFLKLENLKNEGIKNTQIKRLSNYKLSDYRLRIGNYRILFDYDFENKKIIIFRVLHRSKLY